jgi:SAM-dependent methyltransferase
MGSETVDQGDAVLSLDAREAVEAYRRSEAARAGFLAPATELMLDLAGIGAGSRVLDVAAGPGGPELLAARRVGPTGRVVATDLSAAKLEAAREAARRAGLANVETMVADAQALDLDSDSFDAAISRLGLMFIPDLDAALAGIQRALRPGGRLAAMVFSAAERNPVQALALEVASHWAGRPSAAAERPGIFALGDPGELEAALWRANFRQVAVHRQPAIRRALSVAEMARLLCEGFPAARALLVGLGDEGREQARAEIEQGLRRYEGPSGFEAPGEVLIGVGTK